MPELQHPLGSLLPSTLWPSLSCCKVSLGSSSSSSIFPGLICGIIHLKVPSEPKISIVKTEFLFLPLPSIHSLYFFSHGKVVCSLLLCWVGLTLTRLWALPAQPDLSYTILGDAMSLGLGLFAGKISCSGHSHLTPSFAPLTPDNHFFLHVYPLKIEVKWLFL